MKVIAFIFIIILFSSCGSSKNSSEVASSAKDQKVTFNVIVPKITPKDEFICLIFNDNNPPYKMKNLGNNRWGIKLDISSITSHEYKYCRNCECSAADEYLDKDGIGWRYKDNFQVGSFYHDRVNRWRWLDENLTSISVDTSDYISKKPDMNKSDYISGVQFNDWWKHEWLDSVDATIEKASQDLDARWVEIVPVPQVLNINNPEKLKIDLNGINHISDADLEKIITLAHNRGIKVFLNPSPWSFEEDNADGNHSKEWWDSYLTSLEDVLLHYAQIAQENGVDLLGVRAWYHIDSFSKKEAEIAKDKISNLFDNIKTTYSGKIAVQSICYDADRPIIDIHRRADYLLFNIWQYYPWPFATSNDENVSSMKNRLKAHLDDCKKYYNDNNISVPVIIEQLAMASFDGATMMQDIEEIDSFHKDNPNYKLDLQEQADSFEAAFSAMAQEEWIKGDFIFTYFFWDSIGKDINVRGKKPVQEEIKKWHRWLNQSSTIEE